MSVGTLLLGVVSCSDGSGEGLGHSAGTESSSCAATVQYDGRTYFGHGELKRIPETTGRTEVGTVPRCDDGADAELGRDVDVHELREITMKHALLVGGQLYVVEGEPFPDAAQQWFSPPRCSDDGSFTLTGQWLEVTGGPKPRFDGDIRPPYLLEVRVTTGPARYVDSTVKVHADAETDPLLTSKDVERALWADGELTARVHCDSADFVADGLASATGD